MYTIRTNYNVLLFHMIDNISSWSIYITDPQRDLFNKFFGEMPEDNKYLQKFVKKRRQYEWQYDGKILDWAYKGFSTQSQFKGFIDVVEYFNNRKYVKEFLSDTHHDTLSAKKLIQRSITKYLPPDIVNDVSRLFYNPISSAKSYLYLLSSMRGSSIQGGANGGVITIEIPPNYIECNDTIETTFQHEALHMLNRRKKIFTKRLVTLTKNTLYNDTYSEIYPGQLSYFFEEIIIHTISERIINSIDIDDELHRMQTIHRKKQNMTSLINIFKCIPYMEPTISEYLNHNISREETIIKLDKAFTKFIANLQK